MFERLLYRYANDLFFRLAVTGITVIFVTGMSTTWIGAAFQNLLWDYPFAPTMLKVFVFGGLGVFLAGVLTIYPTERWIIQGRAVTSWKWKMLRVILYFLAGIPEGYACLLGIRLGIRVYPPLVEKSYFVQTLTSSLLMGLLYTLIEQVIATIRKREENLKLQIATLQIQIDDIKRQKQVDEIVESDFFQQLQDKARNYRNRAQGIT